MWSFTYISAQYSVWQLPLTDISNVQHSLHSSLIFCRGMLAIVLCLASLGVIRTLEVCRCKECEELKAALKNKYGLAMSCALKNLYVAKATSCNHSSSICEQVIVTSEHGMVMTVTMPAYGQQKHWHWFSDRCATSAVLVAAKNKFLGAYRGPWSNTGMKEESSECS